MQRGTTVAVVIAIIAVISAGGYATFLGTQPPVTQVQTQTQTLVQTQVQTRTQTVTQELTKTLTTTQQPPAPPPPKQLTDVRFQLNWVVDSNQAGFFVAKEKGFYAENGLNVDLFPGRGAVYAINQLLGGNAEFAYTSLNFLLPRRAAGAEVKAVALIYARHPAGYFTFDPKITSPQDFGGKRVAVQSGSAADYAIFKALMAKLGIDYSTIKEIPISFDMWTPLITGNADVSMGWFTNRLSFQQAGVNMSKLKTFRIVDYGLNPVSSGLATTDTMINTKPEVVRAFVNASLWGWKYAFEHPGEAIDIILRANPELNRGIESQLLEIYLTQVIWGEPFKSKGLGHFDQANWEFTQNLMFDTGQLEKKVDLATVYSSQFLPKDPVLPDSPLAPRN